MHTHSHTALLLVSCQTTVTFAVTSDSNTWKGSRLSPAAKHNWHTLAAATEAALQVHESGKNHQPTNKQTAVICGCWKSPLCFFLEGGQKCYMTHFAFSVCLFAWFTHRTHMLGQPVPVAQLEVCDFIQGYINPHYSCSEYLWQKTVCQ